MLQECKKEGLVGQLNPSAQYYSPEPVDYTLDDFLDSQGISTHELENQNPKDSKTEEFILKFEQIRQRYRDELEKLSRVSHEFMQRMLVILRDQASFRPVTDHEIHLKVSDIKKLANKDSFIPKFLTFFIRMSLDRVSKKYAARKLIVPTRRKTIQYIIFLIQFYNCSPVFFNSSVDQTGTNDFVS